MKTSNSIKNSITSLVSNALAIFVGLVAQKIFIFILGKEFLGLNGLFTNIISMLGIVELGIGSAIVYNLYKPLEIDDKETINSLMLFYRKAYMIIAFVVLSIGILIIPFLKFFVNEIFLDINIYLVYLLFLLDIFCSYLLTYKRSILYADQKNYIINIVHMSYLFLMNFFQIFVLILTKNYYFYLILKVIFRILENLILHLIVRKKYSFLNCKNAIKLDRNIEKDIFIKVKALFYHKIGAFLVLGTDNLIISKFLGLTIVGLYSNYSMIIDSLNKLFGQAIIALTPSVGHMLVSDSKIKSFDIFKKIRFANFWIATFAGTGLLVVMDSFITIWLGDGFLFSKTILLILVFNFYMSMMRYSYSTFKEAAGIYYEDRFIPLIESSLNIIFSIALVKIIGLSGVFIGTFLSGLALWCYSYPRWVYKYLFDQSYKNYIVETLSFIFLFIIISGFTYYISLSFVMDNILFNFIKNILITLIVPNTILFLIFRKSSDFNYFKDIFLKITLKIFKR